MIRVLTATILLLGAEACAPTPRMEAAAVDRRQCFLASSVNGFRIVDEKTVDLEVGPGEVFRAELFGACLGLEETVRLGVRGRGGSGWICHGAEATILLPQSAVGPQTCHARSIRKRTVAELDRAPR